MIDIEEPIELTPEGEILQLVIELGSSMASGETLSYLRKKTKFTEAQIKFALDGYPYCVDTDVTVDKYGNRERHAYDIRNYYDEKLVGRLRTTWTYWDAEKNIVKDMIIEDGIGDVKRTIVHHKPNGDPQSVEWPVMKPVEEPIGRRL